MSISSLTLGRVGLVRVRIARHVFPLAVCQIATLAGIRAYEHHDSLDGLALNPVESTTELQESLDAVEMHDIAFYTEHLFARLMTVLSTIQGYEPLAITGSVQPPTYLVAELCQD